MRPAAQRGGTHSALGCMGPAEFGNAGLSPWKTLSWPSRIRRRLGRALPLAISEAPSARRRLIYEMVGAFAYAAKEAP